MSKSTKAPWIVTAGRFIYALDENKNNRFECAVQNGNHQTPGAELDANARLIAAAPDLLEVCKYVLGVINDWGTDGCGDLMWHFNEPVKRLETAIKKAEGEI